MVFTAVAFGREWTIGDCSLESPLTSHRPSWVCITTVLVLTICEAVAVRLVCQCMHACVYSLHHEIPAEACISLLSQLRNKV